MDCTVKTTEAVPVEPDDDTERAGQRSYHIGGAGFDAPALQPGLHVVSTPIGNLRDITIRGLETLAAADMVLCEDTRTSARLLSHYGIRARTSALHEHNERARIAGIVEAIAGGQAVALISDAGTPLLSDPGFPLVRAVREAGLAVFAVPGPSALLAALAIAGLPTDRFVFCGFLPPRSAARRKAIATLSREAATLVFYESPRRLEAALADLALELGAGRPAAVGLELTKRFERLERGTLDELARLHAGASTRGEAVIVVAGAADGAPSSDEWQSALDEALGRLPLRAAVDEITARFSLKRREVYNAALAKKNQG